MIYKSPYKTDDPKITFNILNKEKGVIIFGTGNCGAITRMALENANIKILALSDNNLHRWGKKIDGIDIIPPEKIVSNFKNIPVVIAVDLNFPYIRKQLTEIGVKKIFDCDFVFSELEIDLKKCKNVTWSETRFKQKIDLYMYSVLAHKNKDTTLRVDSIDLMLTEKCSLKCKDCSNLMQYYKKPIDTDYDILVKAMDKIMNSVDFIDELRVLGGDPFMYKELSKIINKLSTYKNVERIVVYTNAKFIPKNRNLDYLRLPRVILDITNYGEASSAADKFVDFAKKEGIAYSMNHCNTWQDCGRIVPKSNKTEKELEHQFNNCCNSDLISLLHGKLFRCPFSANGVNLKAFAANKDDEIDLNDDSMSKKDLRDKIMYLAFGKKFLTACRFCNGRDYSTANIPSAIQAKTKLDYKFQT